MSDSMGGVGSGAANERRAGGEQDTTPRVVRLLIENGRAAWMLVGILVAIGMLGWVFGQIRLVLFAIFVALVHAAIMTPVARWLESHGTRRTPATALSLLLVLTLFGGATALVGYRLADQLPAVFERVDQERDRLVDLLQREPLSMTEAEVEALLNRSVAEVRQQTTGGEGSSSSSGGSSTEGSSSSGDGSSGETQEAEEDMARADDGRGPSPSTAFRVLQQSAVAARVLGAMLIGIVLSFFVVRDRDTIADGVVRHLAGGGHDTRARKVLRAAWRALYGYVQASVTIGAIEGAIIGLTLFLVGTPLAGSLAILTFLAAFVPVVGAIVAGVLAVALTWLGVGVTQAVIVAVVVLAVQQLDSHVLQPKIVAMNTQLHPIATILALMLGGLVGGILGALLAVPIAAVLVAVSSELLDPDLPPAEASA